MRVTRWAWTVVGCLAVAPAALVGAEPVWTEAKSPNFTVISDDGDKTARSVVWQLEQMRAAIRTVWPWGKVDLDRPFVALAVKNEDGMRQLAPKYWEQKGNLRPIGIFASAPDRYYVALRTDAVESDRLGTVNPHQSAYWSYAAIVIDTSLGRQLPLWVSRGLASVMSNTIVRDSSIRVGMILPDALHGLQRSGRLRLTELAQVDRRSPILLDAARLEVFDNEAAVFVHYLMFGDEGIHRAGLDQFMLDVLDGKAPPTALGPSLGSVGALEDGLALYLKRRVFSFAQFAADVNIQRDTFPARPVPAAEAAVTRAGFHAATGRPVEARALLEGVKKTDPALPGPYEVEGQLLEAEGNVDDARRAFERAQSQGSSSFYAKYRWAALAMSQPTPVDEATRQRARRALEEAASLNDRYAPTFSLLGYVQSRLGAPEDAVRSAARAVTLAPDVFQYRYVLASVLASAGRGDEARREAGQAKPLASNDAERKNIDDLFAELARRGA